VVAIKDSPLSDYFKNILMTLEKIFNIKCH